MSVDKLVDSTQLDADLTSVANAIRTKGGTSASLAFPSGFVTAIGNISGGGGGGVLTKLNEIVVSEPVRAVKLDFGVTVSDYGMFVIYQDLTFSTADWLYWAFDATSSSAYYPKMSGVTVPFFLIKNFGTSSDNTKWRRINMSGTGVVNVTEMDAPTSYFYAYMYTASARIATGSRFTLWGAKYADM